MATETSHGTREAAAPAPAAAAAPPSYVRTFNRFELKYILRDEAVRAFIGALEGYARPDPHSGERGYRVSSVYWDSPGLTFFWEKIDGQKVRRKLRFRTYGESPDRVFVEIKQRIDRTVQKRRVLWPLEEAKALFAGGRVDPELEASVADSAALEALWLCRYHRLGPTMAVAYRRRAFFALHEPDLRITFDTRLVYDRRELDPARPLEGGKALLDPRLAVMEIKYNHGVPAWLAALARRHGLELVRISKYCTAVDRELFGGQHI